MLEKTGLGSSNQDEIRRRRVGQPFALLLLASAAGMVFDFYCPIPLEYAIGLAAIALTTGLILTRWIGWHRVSLTIILLFAAFWLGGCWHHLYWRSYGSNDIGRFASDHRRPAALEGRVVRQPEWMPAPPPNRMDRQEIGDRTRIEIEVSHLRVGRYYRRVSGRTIVTVNGNLDGLFAGQKIHLFGQLSKPSIARSKNDFDLRKFYRSKRVTTVLYVNHPEAVSESRRQVSEARGGRAVMDGLTRFVDSVRNHFYQLLNEHMRSSNARLQSALLLGMRTLVSNDQNQMFLSTGTMHLLAISGLHVGILCSGLFLLLRLGWVHHRYVLILIIGFVVFYCLLTQLRPPVVRASILVILYCFSKLFHKRPVSVNSLSLAGLIILVFNPASLFQPGAQLSFLAVSTLIMVNESRLMRKPETDSLKRFLKRRRSFLERCRDYGFDLLRATLISMLAVWVVTLPMVTQSFHIVAPIGILCNLTLMIPIWLSLQFGFLLMLVGDVPFLGNWLGATCDYWMNHILWQVEWAARIPGGHWWTFGFGFFWLGVFYSAFIVFFLDARFRLAFRWQAMLATLWLASALAVPEIQRYSHESKLTVTFIDVKHGTSVLIEFPNGQNVLYDAGSLNSSKQAVARISSILWEKRIYHLDALVLSHADLDHYNAAPELSGRFKVQKLLVSPFMFHGGIYGSLDELWKSSIANRIPVLSICSETRLICDSDCRTSILHPAPDFDSVGDNAKSIVLLIEYAGCRILLTGDLESEGQARLLSLPPIDCDVLLAAHHGSRSTDHYSIAQWASPEHVVVSCAENKLSSQVIAAYEDFQATVYQTAKNGTIEFKFGSKGIDVHPFLK